MTLGPDKLSGGELKAIIKRILSKEDFDDFIAQRIEWSDVKFDRIKAFIRKNLRTQQKNRCIYCRKIIDIERKNANEDIEHFLDKSKGIYRHLAFCATNLSIACHPCNFQKSTKDMVIHANPRNKVVSKRLDTLEFRWLHPYYDSYHQNIEVKPGWIYTAKKGTTNTRKALRLIRECKLDEISSILEYKEKIKDHILKLSEEALAANLTGDILKSRELLKDVIIYQNEQRFNY